MCVKQKSHGEVLIASIYFHSDSSEINLAESVSEFKQNRICGYKVFPGRPQFVSYINSLLMKRVLPVSDGNERRSVDKNRFHKRFAVP